METVYAQWNLQMDRCANRVYLQSITRKNIEPIGMRPCDVTPAIADRLLATVYSNLKIAAPARFKLSEFMRVSKFKTIFDKGYTPNWTTEVFEIAKVQATNPVTYLIIDYSRKTRCRRIL